MDSPKELFVSSKEIVWLRNHIKRNNLFDTLSDSNTQMSILNEYAQFEKSEGCTWTARTNEVHINKQLCCLQTILRKMYDIN